MLTWLRHGLLLSNGRRRRAKITNSFAFSEACAIHVGFFSEISLSSDLVSSLHFWSNTKLKVLPWKPRAVQSRLNKDYGYIYIYFFLFPLETIPAICMPPISVEPEGSETTRQATWPLMSQRAHIAAATCVRHTIVRLTYLELINY